MENIIENIKCVVFDFDDTIILSEEMKQEVFYEISAKYQVNGINYYNDNIQKGLTREQYFKGLSQYIIEKSLVDIDSSKYLYILLLEDFTRKVSDNLKLSEELPNVREFIEHLHNNNYNLYGWPFATLQCTSMDVYTF